MTTVQTGLWLPNLLDNNDITFGTNLKAVLATSAWSPDWDSQLGYASITGASAEHAATGDYTTAGVALSGVSASTAGGRFTLTANNLSLTSVTITDVKFVVVYDPDGTSPVADPIVACFVFSPVLGNSGGTVTFDWNDTPVANCIGALRNPGVS